MKRKRNRPHPHHRLYDSRTVRSRRGILTEMAEAPLGELIVPSSDQSMALHGSLAGKTRPAQALRPGESGCSDSYKF